MSGPTRRTLQYSILATRYCVRASYADCSEKEVIRRTDEALLQILPVARLLKCGCLQPEKSTRLSGGLLTTILFCCPKGGDADGIGTTGKRASTVNQYRTDCRSTPTC